MRGSKQPCMGCGKVAAYRKSTEICNDCQHDIKEGRAHRKAEQESQKKKESIIVRFPEYEHWLPHIQHAEPAYGDHNFLKHLQQTFIQLGMVVSEPASSSHIGEALVKGSQGQYGRGTPRIMPAAALPLFQELYNCIKTAVGNAYTNGEDNSRKHFQNMVSGAMGLKDFAEHMKMNPKEITTRVVFSSAKQSTTRVRACLCRAGQVDARGVMVTPERLADIEKAYRDKEVSVERLGDELWTTGEIPQAAIDEFAADVRAELISGLPSDFSIGTKEGGKDESNSNSGES